MRLKLFTLALFLIAAMFLTAGLAFAQWDPETQLGAGFGWDIAVNGNTVHLIYGEDPILYRRSTDDGSTWSFPMTLASTGRIHLTDMLEASGSDVWALYLKDLTTFTDSCCPRVAGDIYMKRSRDGGLTWDPEVRLTTSQKAMRISIAVSGNRLDIVWGDYRRGIWDVYYRRSLDRGSTWGPEVVLALGDTLGAGPGRPQVAALGDSVHITWGDRLAGKSAFTTFDRFDVYYRRSTDGGSTWGSTVRMSAGNGHSLRSEIAALAPGTVILTWDDDMSGIIQEHARRSTDNGVSWGPPVQLSFSSTGADHNDMVAAGSMVHLAWEDQGTNSIYYRLSPDAGATWLPQERVNTGSGASGIPLMAASSNYLHHTRGGSDETVFYRRRTLPTPNRAPFVDAGKDTSATLPAGDPVPSSFDRLYIFLDRVEKITLTGSNLTGTFNVTFLQGGLPKLTFTSITGGGDKLELDFTTKDLSSVPLGEYTVQVTRLSDSKTVTHPKTFVFTKLGDMWKQGATDLDEQKRDGKVDIQDVSRLLSKWNSTTPQDLLEADINSGPQGVSSGKIDIYDANRLMSNWTN